MINRIRAFLSNRPVVPTATTASTGGRLKRATIRTNAGNGANGSNSGTQQQSQAAQPPTNLAETTAAPNRLNKIRTIFFVIGGGIFVSRVFLDPSNPSSYINRVLYPNLGESKYVLKIEKLDDRIAHYQTSYLTATKGLKAAFSNQQKHLFLQNVGLEMSALTQEQIKLLLKAGEVYSLFMQQNGKEMDAIKRQQMEVIQKTTLKEASNVLIAELNDPKNDLKRLLEDVHEDGKPLSLEDQLRRKLLHLLDRKIKGELAFMKCIESILTIEQKTKFALQKDPGILSRLKNNLSGLDGQKYEFLLEKLAKMSTLPNFERGRVFVITFKGDMMATQVNRLREEITAILNIADASRGDRVIIQLNSGGGTVTGYGLGAAQLLRIKNAGLHLTVSVDEIAASGGYLMASVADKIVASPFALLGSIGVVATIPNFSERMTREGVVVEDVTAGKYKRTMTPYKKATDQDRAKMKSDVESILMIFKDFLKQNRPTLAVDEVATGEVWHGPDALKKGLVDELVTTDDLILQAYESGFEVYAVQVKPKRATFAELMEEDKANQEGSVGNVISTWFAGMLSSLFARVMQETVMRVANGSAFPGGEATATMGDFPGEYPEERPFNHTLLAMNFNTPPKFT